MRASAPASGFNRYLFFVRHGVLIPGALLLLAQFFAFSELDLVVSDHFFDPAHGIFVGRHSAWLEVIGHQIGKSVIYIVWFSLLLLALAGQFSKLVRFPPLQKQTLWLTVSAMGLGPIAVTLLKTQNDHHCPWDLSRYGGAAEISNNWFVTAHEVGRCFPGGHASAGFCLVAIMFAGMRLGEPLLTRIGLLVTLFFGAAFSLVRMMQGAHFMSHNLAAAAVCWGMAALVFALPVRDPSLLELNA